MNYSVLLASEPVSSKSYDLDRNGRGPKADHPEPQCQRALQEWS